MEETIIRLIDFGNCSADAITIKDADDNYNIYVNARLAASQQQDALQHELEHIRRGHFWDERPVRELEKEIEKGMAAQWTAR